MYDYQTILMFRFTLVLALIIRRLLSADLCGDFTYIFGRVLFFGKLYILSNTQNIVDALCEILHLKLYHDKSKKNYHFVCHISLYAVTE